MITGAFKLYDLDNDGYITRNEMLDIVDAIYQMVVSLRRVTGRPSEGRGGREATCGSTGPRGNPVSLPVSGQYRAIKYCWLSSHRHPYLRVRQGLGGERGQAAEMAGLGNGRENCSSLPPAQDVRARF